MKLNYYADTDSLYIDLSERPSVESREGKGVKSALGSACQFYQLKNHKYKTLAEQSSPGEDAGSMM